MQACRLNTATCSLCVFNTGVRLSARPVPVRSCQKYHPLAPTPRQTRTLASNHSQQSTKFREPRHVAKPAKMSWMDSWSRPSKSQATPAPYYLIPGGESTPYCKTCGRVIGKSRDVLLQLEATRSIFELTSSRCTKIRREQERDTCEILLKPVQKSQAWSA